MRSSISANLERDAYCSSQLGFRANYLGFRTQARACTNATVTDLAAGRRVTIRLAGTLCEDCHFFASPLNFTTGNFATNYGRSGNERAWRWVAIRAGWKMTAAARVVSSDRAISLPMLDVPG
jgi:hypothetical protein